MFFYLPTWRAVEFHLRHALVSCTLRSVGIDEGFYGGEIYEWGTSAGGDAQGRVHS